MMEHTSPLGGNRATGQPNVIVGSSASNVEIMLPGLPRGKGRPRFTVRGGFARTYTDDKTASFEGALRLAGSVAMRGRAPLSGPLALDMVAVFPIPASWSKVKRGLAEIGAVRPTGKPDCDNLLKVIDGLNGVVWVDDSQIVSATIAKCYGPAPELAIRVRDHSL
jgi:Holliday junction resolvase RusA-like endonuclease